MQSVLPFIYFTFSCCTPSIFTSSLCELYSLSNPQYGNNVNEQMYDNCIGNWNESAASSAPRHWFAALDRTQNTNESTKKFYDLCQLPHLFSGADA
jgi:hypothetical protein